LSQTPAAAAASLSIENVRHTFGATPVLDDVSLSVSAGEVVTLLGHSGCGKTTMLRIAAGLERPNAGRVILAGREVTGPSVFVPPEQRGVGLMFQDYALFPHLTILDNVTFGLSRRPPEEARATASRALERVGLANYAKDYPHMLSGGEQQRVALARALAPSPGILLMDEPFSNLDQRTREAIREETMGLLREQNTTVVLVTHDPIEAMSLADRIALMRKGRIMQIGTPEELYRQPHSMFAARYFCDLNELEGQADGNVVSCAAGRFVLTREIADGPCIVCIRPQAIALVVAGVEPLTGEILSRRFLGDSEMTSIAIENVAKPLHARLQTGYSAAPGEKVGVKIDPAGVLAFPKTGDGACAQGEQQHARR
jgi:iron(III) transport system ATP-binding protein